MKFLSAFLILTTVFLAPAIPTAHSNMLISVASNGAQGDQSSTLSSVSVGASFIAFDSIASNLIVGDTNGMKDVFVRERGNSQTFRVSIASNGAQGNASSGDPSISGDGRYVVFESWASSLVADDTNGTLDVFIRDVQTNQTSRVSIATDGAQGNGPSADPSISVWGDYVAFESDATNLVAGDTNGMSDVFIHELQTGVTNRVSVASDGTQGSEGSHAPSISADGRYVAFMSNAPNLVAGDTNVKMDIFVRDLLTNQTMRVSVADDGTQGNNNSYQPAISASGLYVTFQSQATNLVSSDTNGNTDIFIHNLWYNWTSLISIANDGTQGNGSSEAPAISEDGRYVTYHSNATNLVGNDTNGVTDVFARDLWHNQTSRVSVAGNGVQANDNSAWPSISYDGYIAFCSAATNLINYDANGGISDVFLNIPLTSVYLPLVTNHP